MNDSPSGVQNAGDTIEIPLRVPAEMVLPVQMDSNGKAWPLLGVQWTRLFDADQLHAAGVKLQWRHPNGDLFDYADVQPVIAERKADIAAGYQPEFVVPSNPEEPQS